MTRLLSHIIALVLLGNVMVPLRAQVAPDIIPGTEAGEVIQLYGWPTGRSASGSREIWNYQEFQVTFEQGRVVSVVPTPVSSTQRQAAPRPVQPPPGAVVPMPPPAPLIAVAPPAPVRTEAKASLAESADEPKPRSGLWPESLGISMVILFGSSALALAVFLFWFRPRRVAISAGSSPPPRPLEAAMELKLGKPAREVLRPVATVEEVMDRKLGKQVPEVLPRVAVAPADGSSGASLTDDLLQKLEWKRIELLVCLYFNETGVRAETTTIGADGGVDVVLRRVGELRPFAYVQCKAWVGKIDVKPIRELFGVMAADGISEGHFVTTGEFTRDALAFAEGKNLTLIDGRGLIARFNGLALDRRGRLLRQITDGDYTTPTCPNCDVKLEWHEGDPPFWGCRNFPRCRTIIRVRAGTARP